MIRAFQWDLARQVERLDFLKSLLPRYAAWGYEELYLHLEDAVHYPSLPGVGRADAYTHAELGELVAAATAAGIRVVPIANLLGHTQYLIKHPDLRDLNELRDERGRPREAGQLCPLHPRTAEVAAALLRDLAPFCTAGKIHVGLDESFHLGRCPRCREEIARIGLGGHFAGHVNRLHALAGAHALQLGIWADMLYFTPEAIPLLPRGIAAYDWYYYPFPRLPRVEFFNFAERDLAAPLQAQGIDYYGCPMNGAFRYEPLPVFGERLANLRSWWRRAHETAAKGFLVTSWEAYRLALETTTAVDAAAANLWLAPERTDDTAMLTDGLARVFGGKPARDTVRQLLAADDHAFAGYARWQINDRWDTFGGDEGAAPYRRELAFFQRLAKRELPAAFAASVAFRRYVAQRDVFVRESARRVFKLRRLVAGDDRGRVQEELRAAQAAAGEFSVQLRAGRQAARAMWRRTRDPRRRGQNEQMLDADAQRLKAWKAWLARAAKQPALVRRASVMAGAWQLQCWVHNVAPAVQKVVAEQRQPDGTWRELAARFTIEFRAKAARPITKLKREFIAPLDDPAAPLRLAVRGVGQVAISHVQLTDGVTVRRAPGYRTRQMLGEPAPAAGFPAPDWNRNAGELAVTLA